VDTLLQIVALPVILAAMQRTIIHPLPKASGPGTSSSLNVVIAYEDFETGKNAKKTYDYLAANLGHECQCANQMWKFEVLSLPKLREIAAKDAAVADIVIISCHGEELPDHLKAWIELWVGQEPSHAIALVALFDCPVERLPETAQTRAYLAAVARRGEMEFFAQPEAWPTAGEFQEVFATSTRGGRERTLSALSALVVREDAVPRWGINE